MRRAVAIALLTAISSAAQTIHSESRLVLVDTVVTDRRGAPVTGLTQNDFKVEEDGKSQVISAFSLQSDASDQKNDLVFLFDNATVEPASQRHARDAAEYFVETSAGPNRRISIVDFNGTLRVTQNFTGDVARLKRALNTTEPGPTTAGTILRSLRDLADGLANVPGRKTAVLFSSGFSAPGEDVNATKDAFNHANVAVYAVDLRPGKAGSSGAFSKVDRATITGALIPRSDAGRPDVTEVSTQNPADALYVLAKGTGGFAVSGTSVLTTVLDEIGKEQTQHYILGYVPAAALKPGTCHGIKVKVDRSGTTVRSRASYCETSEPEVLSGTPTQRDLEARLTAQATPTVQATIEAPFFYTSANTARVDVAMDIASAGINFVKTKDRSLARLTVVGFAYRSDGEVAARFSDTVNLAPQSLTAGTYHYQTQFETPSGKLDLKVAFSSSANSFGSVETPLNIEPWTPAQFALSGLAWSTTARSAGTRGADLFGDKIPLTVNGVELIPSGTNRFRRTQKVYIYAEIYEPALEAYQTLSARMTLVDAGTGQIAQDSGMTPIDKRSATGNKPVPLGLIVPVDGLPAGSYIVRVNVLDGAGNHATRTSAFELVP